MSTNINQLTSLPNDVFTAISSDFDLADLCSLRLTSHNLHAIATTPNFQARFHHIRTDLSKDSLQSLIALCSSPDLSHLIKEITILAKHYDDQELRQQVKEGKRWVAEAAPAPFFHSTGHSMSHEEKSEAQAMIDRMNQLRDRQATMQADSTDAKLLAEAIGHLGARCVSLSVQVAVQTRPEGQRLPISKCRNIEAMSQTMDHTFKATMTALRESQLQISNFSVYDLQWGGFVTLKGLHDALAVQGTDPDTLPAFEVPQPLHSVRSLTLNLHSAPWKKIGEEESDPLDDREPIYGPVAPSALHDAYLTSLAGFLLPTAHALQDLAIRFRGPHAISSDCVKVFGHIASLNLPFLGLNKLHLHNVIIQNRDLLALLRSTPALTQLGLHKVSMPHNPSHPQKKVEYPNARPPWAQMEPDVQGWKDAWKVVFDAFVVNQPPQNESEASLPQNVEDKPLPSPCPRLEILEINALYLTSFKHRVYFTAPQSATSTYVRTIMDDATLKKMYSFKIQAFGEGLACCVFSGSDVRGENTTATATTNDAPDSANEERAKEPHQVLDNELDVSLPPPPSASEEEEPRGIQYIVSTTRPMGSPAYYNWLHFWNAREYGETGCAPEPTTTAATETASSNNLQMKPGRPVAGR